MHNTRLHFLQCCVGAVCILHAFPHTSSNQRQKGATDSTMIASGPIAAQWCADKAGGQQRPCSVLRENVIAELSTEGTKGLKRKEFTCELIRLADYRAKIEDVIRKSSNPISLENLYTILTTTSYSFLKNSINEGERDFGLKINIIWIYKAVPVSVMSLSKAQSVILDQGLHVFIQTKVYARLSSSLLSFSFVSLPFLFFPPDVLLVTSLSKKL